jgi:hypothetical protein
MNLAPFSKLDLVIGDFGPLLSEFIRYMEII